MNTSSVACGMMESSVLCFEKERVKSEDFGADHPQEVEPINSTALAEDVISEDILEAAWKHISESQPDKSFLVVNFADIVDKIKLFKKLLPRVRPHYAVKCFDDEAVVGVLHSHGVAFDCASAAEIKLVLSKGVPPEDVVFANPIKAVDHIRYARDNNVQLMTFDSYDELYKIKKLYPECTGLLVRILPDDSTSVCRLGNKFGADIEVISSLFRLAIDLGFDLKGVAYHVGSGATVVRAFTDAVILARKVFDIAENMGITTMNMLDIGGGFPGGPIDESISPCQDKLSFSSIAAAIRPLLDDMFPESKGYELIAEPGRYFVGSSGLLFSKIIGRRSPMIRENGEVWENSTRYYINDGVYGAFNNTIYDHCNVQGYPAFLNLKYGRDSSDDDGSSKETVSFPSSFNFFEANVWGPTCDGIDCVLPSAWLPELEVGDWLCFPNMGAYTLSAGSAFNGYPLASKMYLNYPVK